MGLKVEPTGKVYLIYVVSVSSLFQTLMLNLSLMVTTVMYIPIK